MWVQVQDSALPDHHWMGKVHPQEQYTHRKEHKVVDLVTWLDQ
jgi:hypothetical protein